METVGVHSRQELQCYVAHNEPIQGESRVVNVRVITEPTWKELLVSV